MVNNVRDMLKQEGDQPMTWEMFSQHLEKPQMLEYAVSVKCVARSRSGKSG